MNSELSLQKKGYGISLKGNTLEVANVKNEELAFHGTPITQLTKDHPQETKLWLAAEIGKVCKFIEANKTLKTQEELFFTCTELLNYCKSWKAEQFLTFFDAIKRGEFGKIYERLKTAEFLEFAKSYELRICDIRERLIRESQKTETKKPVEVVYKPEKRTSGDILKETLNVQNYLSKMSDEGFLSKDEAKAIGEKADILKNRLKGV
jgi:hypothetical protein